MGTAAGAVSPDGGGWGDRVQQMDCELFARLNKEVFVSVYVCEGRVGEGQAVPAFASSLCLE